MKIKDYKELEVWKKGIEIANMVYEITNKFPREEKFGLASHMQKTAVSISSNIAEGFARQYTKEYIQFLRVSLGSCAELETQAVIARNRGYISNEDFTHLEDALKQESRMLMGLIKALSSH